MIASVPSGKVVALCGGIGGVKLALGLYRLLPDDTLSVVVNTGDDFDHLGLRVCPDVDTVLYTLAGLSNSQTGWGRADESWSFMEELERFGAPTWFHLGDRDLALHVHRTLRLRAGETLTRVTDDVRRKCGVRARILPMSDDPVATVIKTAKGDMPFQHYFVRDKCEPVVTEIAFEGAGAAHPSLDVLDAFHQEDLSAVLICPSNPYLSIDPILAVPGIRDGLAECRAPVVAVSPIVGGTAIKGPTAKVMRELGVEPTPMAIEMHYAGLIDGFLYDVCDKDRVGAFSVPATAANTVMRNLEDRIALARTTLRFAAQLDQRASREIGRCTI